MSWYYSYYIGYRKDGKIYPLAPFNCNQEIYPALEKSRSFASDLYQNFYVMSKELVSEPLRKAFGEYFDKQVEEKLVAYLPLKDFEAEGGEWIKKGFCLFDDVQDYLEGRKDSYDLLYCMLSPEIYALKMNKENTVGMSETEEYSYKDYVYFAFPDFNSKEYEVFIITEYIEKFRYEYDDIVIILCQG